MSDYEQVKESVDIRDYLEAHNIERRGHGSYVCPKCGSGTGPKGTAAFTVDRDGKHAHCYSCGFDGDVFDLAGIIERTDDKGEQLKAVASWARLDVHPSRKKTQEPAQRQEAVDENISADMLQGREYHRQYIESMRANIEDPAALGYLYGRGFTHDEIVRFGLGYDPQRQRIVIPWPGTGYYHSDRTINAQEGGSKYVNPNRDSKNAYGDLPVGPRPIWNVKAMDEPVYFIVEGPMDALAVEACGQPAIALAGCSVTREFVNEASRHSGVAVVFLDDDDAGTKGADRVTEQLRDAGVKVRNENPFNVFGGSEKGIKDAADAMLRDRDRFSRWLEEASRIALDEAKTKEDEENDVILSRANVKNPVEVAEALFTLENAHEPVPTGLSNLDAALDGGLPSIGVVTLGAQSSIGKTTLAVQIADNIASSGRPVLFVTIEQSAEEIVSKSLSRLMSCKAAPDGHPIVASAEHIRRKSSRAGWDQDKNAAFASALNEYAADIAPSLKIMEMKDQPTVLDVRSVVEAMRRKTGQSPVVFVDYLQLMAPAIGHERDTEKQVIDRNMMELRHMARDLDTCVFVISSLNRQNYQEGVVQESFKESGSIEYSSDLLLGLQPMGHTEDMDGTPEAQKKKKARQAIQGYKSSVERECEVVVLKNRNGGLPRYDDVPAFKYNALCNRFSPLPRYRAPKGVAVI